MQPFTILTLYNAVAFALCAAFMIVCKKTVRSEKTKDLILKWVAVAVVVIHYSSLYVDYFSNQGQASIDCTMILPVYPCNIVMWLLLVVAFMKNKQSSIYKTLAEFTFLGGTFCGAVGALFNINFLNNPNLADYDIFKGLFSHSVMVFGTVYLFVFDYVKIEVARTTKNIFIGLLIFAVCGLLVNTLFAIFDISSVNAMFMLEPPLPELPFFNFFTIGILGLIVVFLGLNVYERFAFKKEDRWLTKFINKRGK